MHFIKLIILLCICFLIKQPCYSASSADAPLTGTLAAILSIDGYVVNGIDYPCGGTAPLVVETKIVVNPNLNILALTPVKVKFKSNVTGFKLSGTFTSLSKAGYTFPTSALSLSPTSETVTNPTHPIHISNNFTPSVKVTPAATAGIYNGVLTFTVSSI